MDLVSTDNERVYYMLILSRKKNEQIVITKRFNDNDQDKITITVKSIKGGSRVYLSFDAEDHIAIKRGELKN